VVFAEVVACAGYLGRQGDVAENRDFISLSHEMEIPMAEIARHVGDVDQLSLRQFEKWSQQIGFIDFIDVPIFSYCIRRLKENLIICLMPGIQSAR
jgi:hypothetical protein